MNPNAPFFDYLAGWLKELPELSLEGLIERSGGPEKVAVVAVDVVNGFCKEGTLASPRVGGIVEPVRSLLGRAHQLGVRRLYCPCDAHPPDSPEFQAFPPHCLAGSREAELVEELKSLPFPLVTVPKTSIHSLVETTLAELLGRESATLICVGDCTDLCLYHLATGLRFRADALGLEWRVVIDASAVETYDLPVEVALSTGAKPHPGDVMHSLFLYHLDLVGCEVYARLQ